MVAWMKARAILIRRSFSKPTTNASLLKKALIVRGIAKVCDDLRVDLACVSLNTDMICEDLSESFRWWRQMELVRFRWRFLVHRRINYNPVDGVESSGQEIFLWKYATRWMIVR